MKRLTLLPIMAMILGCLVLFGCAAKQVPQQTVTVYTKPSSQQHKEPISPPARKASVARSQSEEKISLKTTHARVRNDSNCEVSVRVLFLPEPKMAVYLPTFVVLTPGTKAIYKIPLGATHIGLQFRGQNIIYFKPQTKYRNATIYAHPAPGASISLQPGICPTVLRGLETPYSWSFE